MVDAGRVVHDGLELVGGQHVPRLGLEEMDAPLVNSQPEVPRPVAGKGLVHVVQGCSMEGPTLD